MSRLPDATYRLRVWPTLAVDYISDQVADQTGYTPEEFKADPDLVLRIIHPDDRSLIEERIKVGPTEAPIVLRWLRKDGRTAWVEHRETALRDRSGELIAIEGIGREIPDPTRVPGATIRVVDGVRIDFGDRRVHVDGRPVLLSPVEYRLLVCLTDAPGKVRTPGELMRHVWRSAHVDGRRTCANYVSALRRKIERDPRFPERIVTVRGRGYMYAVV